MCVWCVYEKKNIFFDYIQYNVEQRYSTFIQTIIVTTIFYGNTMALDLCGENLIATNNIEVFDVNQK